MTVRIAVVVAVSVFAAGLGAQVPPPMFSPGYEESLRDILKLEEPNIATLERKLASNPEDFPTRLKLMAYEMRSDRAANPMDRAKRTRHVFWIIEHHPNSELLHSSVSSLSRGDLPDVDYRRVVALWDAASRASPRDPAVQWNAASFFRNLDPELHMRYLEATAAADPNHPYAIRPLADLYALSILNGGTLGARAQAGLDASKNVWVLSNAAYMLQSQYNLGVQRDAPDLRAAGLAEHYFQRAKLLDPNLDRQKILPQLPPTAAQSRQAQQQTERDWQEQARKAVFNIRRLPVESFPNLPTAVASVLHARNCRVPQPSTSNAPRNVIRGDFFIKGEEGWAVLCSVNNRTALLAFRNDRDLKPDTVTTSDDQNYLQAANAANFTYSHEIAAVGRDFIVGHYRAYGGPAPPPIDHQGIDDSFLEKASVTWYCHDGKWRQLQGAD